jgi:hypothetical protein
LEITMNPKPRCTALLSSILAASLFALCSGVRADPLDDVKARLDVLDRKVVALEKQRAATALPDDPKQRRGSPPRVSPSAIDVQLYLQYPGQ